jgi:hypothetical protein
VSDATLARGLSPEELVERVRRSGTRVHREMLVHLLDELRAEGHVENVEGRWRLTPEAQERFGPALLKLRPRTDA